MKFSKRTLSSALLIAFSTQAYAAKEVTLNCSVQEGFDSSKKFVIESPFGGGKQFSYKTTNKTNIVVTVLAEENQDDKKLLDLSLLVDNEKNMALSMVVARGLAKNSYKENGLTTTVFPDKNGSELNSIQISCKL